MRLKPGQQFPWAWLGVGLAGAGGLLVAWGAAEASNPGRPRPRLPVLTMGDSIAWGTGAAIVRQLDPGQARVKAVIGESAESTVNLAGDRLLEVPDARAVVLSTGTNSLDRTPLRQLTQLIIDLVWLLRATGREVIILGPPPLADYRGGDLLDGAAGLRAGLRQMEYFVDLWTVLGEGDGGYLEGLGAPDHLHPTVLGYELLAQRCVELLLA